VASGEPASIVQTHRAGLVVAPKDTDALAGALRRLRDNPSLRAELGENGRRAAERFFDRAEIAREFILHLQNALTY
jgi:glycosyltransferase involved in cell wall biosynthesis